MPDPSVKDQPTLYRLDQLRELPWENDEAAQNMLNTIEAAPKGSEVLLPLEDGERVRYVWDGDELLFRADTKPAQVLRSAGERLVVKHG